MPKMIHIDRADGSHYYYKEAFLLPAVCRCRIHRQLTEKSSPPQKRRLRSPPSLSSSLSFSLISRTRCEIGAHRNSQNAYIPTSLKPTTADPGHFHGICARQARCATSASWNRASLPRAERGERALPRASDLISGKYPACCCARRYVTWWLKCAATVLRSPPLAAPAREAGRCARWPSKQYGRWCAVPSALSIAAR